MPKPKNSTAAAADQGRLFRAFGDASGAQISIAPESWNPADRSIEINAGMGADVRRRDWRDGSVYIERLSMDASAVDLSRLNSGVAPLLDCHSMWDSSDVRGVVPKDSARIENGSLVLRAVLSDAAGDADFARKVSTGILRGCSLGYLVLQWEVDDTGDTQIRTATLWQPYEVSIVPVGADPSAQVRNLPVDEPKQLGHNRQEPTPPAPTPPEKRSAMTPEEIAAQKSENERALSAAVDAAKKDAIKEHKARNAAIDVTVRALGLDAAAPEVRVFIDGDQPIGDVRAALIDIRAAKADATPTHGAHRAASYGEGDAEKRFAGMEEALTRSWLNELVPTKETDNGNRFMGRGVKRLMADCLELAGVRTMDMRDEDIWRRSVEMARGNTRSVSQMGTNDFFGLLGNIEGKSLRAAYAAEKRPWQVLVRRIPVQNFKPQFSLQVSAGSDFQEVAEGGEFTLGTVNESKETWRLLKYGGIDAFTWEMFLADELGAFLRVRAGKGAVAARKESQLFYSMFNPNSGAGEDMADGEHMCSTAHGNIVSGGGNVGAPTVTTIGAVRNLFASQTGLDGEPLEIDMAYLLYPHDLDTAVDKVLSRKIMATKSDDITPDYINDLKPIRAMGRRLTSTTGWYGIASPADIESLIQGYLAGYEGVRTENRQSFKVDGWEFKAALQTAFKCVDYRGVVFNPGA